MGCAASRHGAVSSPSYDVSSCSYNMSRSASASAELGGSSSALSIWSRPVRLEAFDNDDDDNERRRRSGREAAAAAAATATATVRLGNVRRCVEGEQAAAGWPSWLSAVAAEAVHGWVPLRAESFEKLEKVGQGTYSSVFRARELATGRLVALKKVRFDSVEPESVRFMAREILILRRLRGHPNVVGLEGLITSRSSSSIYLVFEYLEHDLAGLNSSPDITFTESQVRSLFST
jgi:cyclin-dependent kinase 12/13